MICNTCSYPNPKNKRVGFSLIEVALALPLVTLIISSLIFTLLQSKKNESSFLKKEKQVLQAHFFQRRLQKLLSLISKQTKLSKQDLQKDQFTFKFYNGPTLDKLSKGDLKAKIFLEKNALKLSLYKEKTLISQETLLKPIDRFKIEYLFESKEKDKDGSVQYKTIIDPEKIENLKLVGLYFFLEPSPVEDPYFFYTKRGL